MQDGCLSRLYPRRFAYAGPAAMDALIRQVREQARTLFHFRSDTALALVALIAFLSAMPSGKTRFTKSGPGRPSSFPRAKPMTKRAPRAVSTTDSGVPWTTNWTGSPSIGKPHKERREPLKTPISV
jgi:hypothetical protein